jgi:hypothetical protein
MADYIDFKNRHLCDPDKEYCVLNLDLDGTPYNGYIVTYHRDKKHHRKLALTDNGASIKAELASQGWKIVHQNLVRGGIYQVFHYERPRQTAPSPSKQPTHIRPTEKDKMRDGMEYACLLFNRNLGKDESFTIEFYDKRSYRKTDLMRGITHADVLRQMEGQGWQHIYGTGDGEGVMNYFQRTISPANDPNWIPIIPESAPTPTITRAPQPVIDRRQNYVQRPKWNKGRTGELEDGVEYMEIVFYRNFQQEGLPTEIITYGKGIPKKSQKKYMTILDYENYLKELEREGWSHVHGTGDSEGILAYLERQRIMPMSESTHKVTPATIPPTNIHQQHIVMIGGEQHILESDSNSLFTEISEKGGRKRQTGNIKQILAQSIAEGWSHLATHISDTKTAFILGRDGHIISSEHITPEHHAKLPAGARITRIEDLGAELKVCAYDNQKVDNIRNQKKSLAEFVANMTRDNDWLLVYETQESGHRVIYLGRIK